MAEASKWSDLAPRVISAIVMSAVGLFAIWQGGLIFGVLVAIASGLILWEVARMLAPEKSGLAQFLGLLGGAVILLAGFLPGALSIMLVLAGAMALAILWGSGKERGRFFIYALWIMVAGFGLTVLRAFDGGLMILAWLVAVVIATDTAGYFAGKTFGGPKFWPRISPKKTWSGTIGGWVAAGLVGLAFGGVGLALISVFISFASQMGDAAESALKRHTGIKDSSNLIPGHGGVFDRFDALMGAALVMTILHAWAGPVFNG